MISVVMEVWCLSFMELTTRCSIKAAHNRHILQFYYEGLLEG